MAPNKPAATEPLDIPDAMKRVAEPTEPTAEKPKVKTTDEQGASSILQSTPNPFSAKSLRLPPAYEVNAGIRKQFTTVPVRKPHAQEWIRVHPDPAYREKFGVIILKADNTDECYLLDPALVPSYENEMTRVIIFTAMSMNKVTFLWPCKLPGSGHRNADKWNNSAIEAAEAAMKRKVRIQSNKALGAYEYAYSDNPTPENDPVWPDVSFDELLRLGFVKEGRYISDHEHEVLKLLRQGY
jgi:hypothetical protein